MSPTKIQNTLARTAQDFTTHLLGDDKKHDLTTQLHYHKAAPDGSTATIAKYHDFDPDHHDPRSAIVHDVRGSEADYTLEDNGFQYLKNTKPADMDFANDEQIKKEHYPAMEEFLKNVTGASKVIIFNHVVRDAPHDKANYAVDYKGPAARPHVDITPKFAPKLLERIVPLMRSSAEYDSIITRRWQVVNLWRPLSTIKKDPLCIADYTSVAQADLVPYEYNRGEMKHVENYWVASGLGEGQKDEDLRHKWYYLHEQTPEEVLLFKIYDSDEGAKTKGVAHSAVNVEGMEEVPPRQSIEMRAFVCY